MPPMRTTLREKPPKSQRTQEENQERAYIAASRRSDRTLEARVESARRASEVHKRRTGRALRITAEDVMNEEMYEEEGDDLPIQYRRLTAHLQTSSADFNHRIAAYLTHQVAIRSAIEQMARDPHGQYPNGAFSMFPSPMLPPHGMSMSPPMGAYQRPAPYPSPHQAHFPQNSGRRADSLTSARCEQESISPSAPAHTTGPMEQANMPFPGPAQVGNNFPGQHIQDQGSRADVEFSPQAQGRSASFTPLWQNMAPFTTSLPPESQQMLAHAPGFDVNDPFYAMLMRGSDQYLSNSYYPWKSTHNSVKDMSLHDSAYQGMNATLAPAALDRCHEDIPKSNTSPTSRVAPTSVSAESAGTRSLESSGLDFDLKQESIEPSFFAAADCLDSGQATPSGDGFWGHFVRDGSWDGDNNEAHALATGNDPGGVDGDLNVKVERHD